MLHVDQFVASKSLDEDKWLACRRLGLSATTMSLAMTPSGYRDVVTDWDNETPIPVNAYMQFGLDSEAWLADWAKTYLGLMPNDWLIRHELDPIAIATPDLLSLDHETIGEIKTTGKDWGTIHKVPINYVRQVQWQLYVTGAKSCAFVWLLREQTDDGVMVPAWLEPKYGFINRDEDTIEKMRETAYKLWAEVRGKNGKV